MKTAVVLAAFSALVALARAQSPLASFGGGGSPMGMGMNRMMLPMLMSGMDMKNFALMNMLGGGMGGGRMLPLVAALRGNENMLPLLLASKGGMGNPLTMMAMMGNDNLMSMLPFMMSSGMGMGGGGGGGGMMGGGPAGGGGAGGPGM